MACITPTKNVLQRPYIIGSGPGWIGVKVLLKQKFILDIQELVLYLYKQNT